MSHARALTAPRTTRQAGAAARAGEDDGDLDWSASGTAGLLAGLLMIVVETGLSSLFVGGSDTDPVRRIAAIALGQSVLPATTPFTALVFLAAMSVHLPLSLLYARVLAALVRDLDGPGAAAGGALFGAALYALNYHALSGVLPWFADARGWISLASHIVFGATAGGLYIALRGPRPFRRNRSGWSRPRGLH